MQKEIIDKIMNNLRAGGGQRVSYRFVLNRLNGNEKILDVGCGFGRFNDRCAKAGLNMTGIDPYNRTNEPSFRYIEDDFMTHNFEKERFDVVISLSAIEHFGMNTYENKRIDDEAPRKSLEKMTTLSDKVIITIPIGAGGDSHWFRCFDEERLDKLLEGFNVTEKVFVACNNDWKKWNIVSKERAFNSQWLKSKIPSALVCFVIEKQIDVELDNYHSIIFNTLEKKKKFTDRKYFPMVIDHILDLNPYSILEIGCGKGHLLNHITKKLPESNIVGIDAVTNKSKKHFSFYPCEFEDFGDDTHDNYGMIICLNVMHYVLNMGNFLEKISRYLSSDGEFYGCVPYGVGDKHSLNVNLFNKNNLNRMLSFYFNDVDIKKWKNMLFFKCRGSKYE